MSTQYTNLLGFALPVTGELNGTWGDVVNDSITELVEDSIAGQATASVTSGDWTLTTTGSGLANQARCAILIPTGTPGVSRNVIAPSSSKAYIVINQSDASVVIKGAATTGVTIGAGAKALVAWNGTDFVQVGSSGTVTSVTGTSPVASSGGAAPAISLSAAYGDTQNPYASKTANYVLASPNGSSGVPSFRALGATDLPTVPVSKGGTGLTSISAYSIPVANSANTYTTVTPAAGQSIRLNAGGTAWEAYSPSSGTGSVTSVDVSGGTTGLTTSGGPITTDGTITLTGTLSVGNGGTGVTSSTGSGSTVLSSSPSLVTPVITSLREVKTSIASSDINLSSGNYFSKTITTTTTFTVSNIPNNNIAISFILDLTNGGSQTITWWAGVTWPYGTAPTLSTSGRDSLGFYTYDNGNTWTGLVLGKGIT